MTISTSSHLHALGVQAIIEDNKARWKASLDYCYFTLGYWRRYSYEETEKLIEPVVFSARFN